MICTMERENNRRSKVTPETQQEAQRLAELWAEAKAAGRVKSQAEFGERFEIGNQSAVAQFLKGDRVALSLKAARGFALGLGVDVSDFSPRLAAEAAKLAPVTPVSEDDEFVRVRRADVAFAQGHGKVVYRPADKSALAFRRDYLRKLGVAERSVLIVDAEGRSNEPDIPDGAVLMVTTTDNDRERMRDGKYYAFRIGERLLIKKLYRQEDGTIRAVAGNPTWEDEIIDGSDEFEVIGRVLWAAAEL